MLRQFLGLSCVIAATAAAAEPARLSSHTLSETVAGAVIDLDTPIGTKIPMRFGKDGLVSGEAGILGTFLGAAKDRGRWWVANDQLCIKWFRWFSSEPRCMEIRVDGTRIFWRKDDGDTGTATLTAAVKPVAAPQPPPKAAASVSGNEPKASISKPAAEPPKVASVEAPAPSPDLSDAPAAAPDPAPAELVARQDPNPAVSASKATTKEPAQRNSPAVASLTPPNAKPRAERSQEARRDAPPSRTASVVRKPQPQEAPGSFRVARVDEDDMLNVRSGPSEDHTVIGIISPRGYGVKIIGACAGEWCPVRHGSISGWVNSYYLAQEGNERR